MISRKSLPAAALVAAAFAVAFPALAFFPPKDARDGGPALRISWNMPGATRSPNGSPRFTRLGIGPASLPANRAYMSFGNVLEEPRSFELTGGLFKNMARHAGRRCAFAASDNAIFVDGRPDRHDGSGHRPDAQALTDFAALGIRTDGAFRLERDGDKALTLTPVPDSGPFRVEIDLARIARLGATPLRSSAPAPVVAAVEPIGPSPDATPPDWNQKDGILSLTVDSKSFAYRISL